MTNTFYTRDLFRWLIAAGAVIVAFFIGLYFNLFVLMFSSFPKDLAEPTAGFTMGLLLVLAGSLLAPRLHLAVALALFVAGTAFVTTLLSYHLLGTLTGGTSAVIFVAWRHSSWRTKRVAMWVGISVCVLFFAFIGLVIARFTDQPAKPEPLAPDLVRILGKNTSLVNAFYCYDRGGFIDNEWLWRIDATPEAIALVVRGLGLHNTNAVPPDFWRMPPHYWPRFMPSYGEAFQSPMFSGDSRGSDGIHYFMVHDKTQNRAFIWVKDNF